LYYTASGIIKPIGVMIHSLWYHHTYKCDDTRGSTGLYMFRAHVLIIRRSKLHYTASGNITPTGVMLPEALQVSTCLYMFRAHVLIIRRSKLHYTASGIITPIDVMIPEAV